MLKMSGFDLAGRGRALVDEGVGDEEEGFVSLDIREERRVVNARVDEEMRSFFEVVDLGCGMA
jgi:hypothetical protein